MPWAREERRHVCKTARGNFRAPVVRRRPACTRRDQTDCIFFRSVKLTTETADCTHIATSALFPASKVVSGGLICVGKQSPNGQSREHSTRAAAARLHSRGSVTLTLIHQTAQLC